MGQYRSREFPQTYSRARKHRRTRAHTHTKCRKVNIKMVKKDNKMENKVEKMEIERRESKRRRKENSAYKDFVIEVVKEKMDVWKEAKGKCKTCEEENIANECNACKEWECHICTE